MARTIAGIRTLVNRNNSILYNGNFEVAPAVLTAQTQTNNRWIDGTSAGSTALLGIGWAFNQSGSSGRAGFDNTTSHSGTYSMKLSATTTGATSIVSSYKTSTPTTRELFLLKANTAYNLTAWVKTSNAVTNSVFVDLREYSAAIATLATTSSNKLSGTVGFTQVSLSVTTNASTVFGSILLRINLTGNIADAWFDDIVLSPTSLGRSNAGARSSI